MLFIAFSVTGLAVKFAATLNGRSGLSVNFRQIAQFDTPILCIVRVDQRLAVTCGSEKCRRGASTMRIVASPGLHGSAGLEACNAIRGYAALVHLAAEKASSVRVTPRKIQEIYAGEDDEKST